MRTQIFLICFLLSSSFLFCSQNPDNTIQIQNNSSHLTKASMPMEKKTDRGCWEVCCTPPHKLLIWSEIFIFGCGALGFISGIASWYLMPAGSEKARMQKFSISEELINRGKTDSKYVSYEKVSDYFKKFNERKKNL